MTPDPLLAALLGDDLADAYTRGDEEGRHDAVMAAFPEADGLIGALHPVVIGKVAGRPESADPPDAAVREAIQRCLDTGLPPEIAVRQVATLIAHQLGGGADLERPGDAPDPHPLDAEQLAAALATLPLPEATEIVDVLRSLTREHLVLTDAELLAGVAERLGRDDTDPFVASMVQSVEDLMTDDHGPLLLLPGGRIASVEALAEGRVLTCALSAEEVELDLLDLGFDLALFRWADEPRTTDGAPIEPVVTDANVLQWEGPEGWLEGFSAGDLVAVTVDRDQTVTLAAADTHPPSPARLGLLREAYDEEVADPPLPVGGIELLAGIRLRDDTAFSAPEPPLSALVDAAGLDRRGDEVAHDPSLWVALRRMRTAGYVEDAAGEDTGLRDDVLALLEGAEALVAGDEVDRRKLERIFAGLTDPEVLPIALPVLLDPHDRGGAPATGTGEAPPPLLHDLLLERAWRPAHEAAAHYLAALATELEGDAPAALPHLEAAHVADRANPMVIDRLAWYAADAGDATRAARLWQQVQGSVAVAADLAAVMPFATLGGEGRPGEAQPDRNDPCWCGSGRKFKRCHQGQPRESGTADRTEWLYRKACAYLTRVGMGPQEDIDELAHAFVADDHERCAAAATDPFVVDLALFEAGWWTMFVEDRSPLLPADERLLAEAWVDVRREVYEVLPGDDRGRRRLRRSGDGEVVPISDRGQATALSDGGLILGRVVPDGAGLRLQGPVLDLTAEDVEVVGGLLDPLDALGLAAWAGTMWRG